MESRFGFAINYNQLTYPKAQRLSIALNEELSKVRKSYGIHTAEKNPKYMEMLIALEGLNSWLANHDMLMEDELATAEAVLAAKAMSDEVQNMVKTAGKMKNEELPALLASIQTQIGTAQADQFKASVTQVLQDLEDTLNATRDALDSSARVLSGDEQMSAAGGIPPGEGSVGGEELPPPESSDIDTGELPPPPGGEEEMPRARR